MKGAGEEARPRHSHSRGPGTATATLHTIVTGSGVHGKVVRPGRLDRRVQVFASHHDSDTDSGRASSSLGDFRIFGSQCRLQTVAKIEFCEFSLWGAGGLGGVL
eukprot:3683988-Rhodomonas_salina.1